MHNINDLPLTWRKPKQQVKPASGLSDEKVVQRWAENPYWQYFCGETHFQHELPLNPSSLSHWRKRLGEVGVESLLSATIEVALTSKAVTTKLKTVLGQVVRDHERTLVDQPEAVQDAFAEELALARRLLAQQRQEKTNCTHRKRRKWSTLPRAKCPSITSSVSKSRLPPPTDPTWSSAHNRRRAIHTMTIHSKVLCSRCGS